MKRLVRSRVAWLAMAIAIPLLSSCQEDSIVGSYAATTFTYALPGSTAKDVLAAGGSINLTIYNDYSTSGSMSIPASVTGTTAATASLIGNAVKSGDIVTLQLVVDTFLRDMEFTFDGTSLTGSGTFSGTVVVVTLSK